MNRISGTHQREEPDNFQGGIIADSMGLGKTLTMIALAASDLMCASSGFGRTVIPPAGQTLVVVPPPRTLIKNALNTIGILTTKQF